MNTKNTASIVTRKYLKDYGSESIDKIILIGTPNNGVSSEIMPICKAFGRNTECDEMKENSEFIINLEKDENTTTPIFTIAGTGCGTFGSDGDGIVPSKSVPLSFAQNKNFTGICSITGGFHTGLPDPEQNPKIYDEIKKILNSS